MNTSPMHWTLDCGNPDPANALALTLFGDYVTATAVPAVDIFVGSFMQVPVALKEAWGVRVTFGGTLDSVSVLPVMERETADSPFVLFPTSPEQALYAFTNRAGGVLLAKARLLIGDLTARRGGF